MSRSREVLWSWLRVRKKWWLGPILVTALLLAGLVLLSQGSAVAPFPGSPS